MLDRVEDFQNSFGGLCDTFRVRAIRLTKLVLLAASFFGLLVGGQSIAESAPLEPSGALAETVSVVRADNGEAGAGAVNLIQQLGAQPVGDFDKPAPIVSPDRQVVSDESDHKPGNSGNEPRNSVYVSSVHTALEIGVAFLFGILVHMFVVAKERREDFRIYLGGLDHKREFEDNVAAMVSEIYKLKNRPCNDIIFEFMFRRRGLAAK